MCSLYLQVSPLTDAATGRSECRSGRVCIHFAPLCFACSFKAGLDFCSAFPEIAAPSDSSRDGIASIFSSGELGASQWPPATGLCPLAKPTAAVSLEARRNAHLPRTTVIKQTLKILLGGWLCCRNGALEALKQCDSPQGCDFMRALLPHRHCCFGRKLFS